MGLFVLIYIKIKEGNIMIKNKICKVLACLVVALMIFTTVGQTAVYAAKKTESKTFVLSNKRKVKNNNGEYIDKGEYKLNTGSDYPIFQIISKNGTEITGTNYYCLKAKVFYKFRCTAQFAERAVRLSDS